MSKRLKITCLFLLVVGIIVSAIIYLHGTNIEVLNPKGPVGAKERNLIYAVLLISLVVIIPVFSMTFFFAWKYREGNKSADYRPNWDHNSVAEGLWWGIPTVIIAVLSVIGWNSSHALDPYKRLSSKNGTITIQVVALDWKWLFIYPLQKIASINYVQFPAQTAVNFEITADAPMNSFWIPQLGGQIYAMPGMSSQINLLAYAYGSYRGSSANISGFGFAGMDFTARSSSIANFEQWVNKVQKSSAGLNMKQYNNLAKPSQNNPVAYYSLKDNDLYNSVLAKYAGPSGQMAGMYMQ